MSATRPSAEAQRRFCRVQLHRGSRSGRSSLQASSAIAGHRSFFRLAPENLRRHLFDRSCSDRSSHRDKCLSWMPRVVDRAQFCPLPEGRLRPPPALTMSPRRELISFLHSLLDHREITRLRHGSRQWEPASTANSPQGKGFRYRPCDPFSLAGDFFAASGQKKAVSPETVLTATYDLLELKRARSRLSGDSPRAHGISTRRSRHRKRRFRRTFARKRQGYLPHRAHRACSQPFDCSRAPAANTRQDSASCNKGHRASPPR